MPTPNASFFEEMSTAARGVVALLVGKRDAPSYFDFSQRGLVGSLIGVVFAVGLAGFGPLLIGVPLPPGAATQSIIVNAVLFIAQLAMAWIVLRQMGRQDGFVPYLVASNWVTFVSAILLLLSTLLGPAGIVILVVVMVMAITTFINVGRFIVTLSPIQIALLFVSQAVGVFLALGIVAVLLGPPAVA